MRKSHKMILSLYIVFIMAFSFNGIICNAENVTVPNPLNFRMFWKQTCQSPSMERTVYCDYSSLNKRSGVRSIFIKDKDFIDGYLRYKNWDVQGYNIYGVILTNDSRSSYYTLGYSYSGDSNENFGYSVPTPDLMDVNYLYPSFNAIGYTSDYFGAFVIHSVFNNSSPGNFEGLTSVAEWVTEEIPCVTSVEDAYKYLFQNDDSVVVNDSPIDNEIIDQNGNIPTPQGVKLYNDGQCVGLVWDNPKMINKLVGKYGDVSVEIKFRPTLNYNLDLFRSKTLTPTDYIGGITTNLSDHGSLYNGFMTLFSNSSAVSNKLDKYNIKFDDKYIFTDNILDTDYANVVCKMLGHKLWYVPDSLLDAVLPATLGGSLPANTLAGEMIDKKSKGVKAGEGGSALDTGLKVLDSLGNLSDFSTNVKELMNNVTVGHSDYMIRYYMMDGNNKLCSKWVNVNQTYDDNANATDEQSTNFKDVENNPVDNPNYNYPSSTSSSSSTGDSWWIHFDDSTKTVFDSLSEQMEQLTESDGGFMQFFGELFSTFPWLAGIFMLALSIALFLRIFGR